MPLSSFHQRDAVTGFDRSGSRPGPDGTKHAS